MDEQMYDEYLSKVFDFELAHIEPIYGPTPDNLFDETDFEEEAS